MQTLKEQHSPWILWINTLGKGQEGMAETCYTRILPHYFPENICFQLAKNILTTILFQKQNFQTHRDYYSHILTGNIAVLEISSVATSRDKKVILFHCAKRFFFNGLAQGQGERMGGAK